MIDDYGTQITADSNVQLDSDTTLYARYGTGFTSYTSYWKAPGVLHIDIDNVEHYPTYRIAVFRGNESLKDAVILPDIIDASNCQIDLDIKYAGVPFVNKVSNSSLFRQKKTVHVFLHRRKQREVIHGMTIWAMKST